MPGHFKVDKEVPAPVGWDLSTSQSKTLALPLSVPRASWYEPMVEGLSQVVQTLCICMVRLYFSLILILKIW